MGMFVNFPRNNQVPFQVQRSSSQVQVQRSSSQELVQEAPFGLDTSVASRVDENGYGTITFALGEDGNFLPRFGRSIQTEDARQVLREADQPGPGGPNIYPAPPDGELTREELNAYSGKLGQQIQFLEFFKNFFGGSFGGPGNFLDQYIGQLRNKQRVASVLNRNFSNIAQADSFGGFRPNEGAGRSSGNPFTISQQDLSNVSNRDGNPSNISPFDLFRPSFRGIDEPFTPGSDPGFSPFPPSYLSNPQPRNFPLG